MECHLIPGVPEASMELHMVRGGVARKILLL
jgi:hypothetical protein